MKTHPLASHISHQPPRRLTVRYGGFTLIELLTVIAIIGILAGILIPVVGSVREKAKKAQCISNLHQMGVALIAYSNDRKSGNIPPAYLNDGRCLWDGDTASGSPVAYGYLQYEGYLGTVSGKNIKGPNRSKIFKCPSYPTEESWETNNGFGSYFYTAGHKYYDSTRDKNGRGMGVPVSQIDPIQAVITDFVPQTLTTASHDKSSSTNVLYVDGSVKNIQRKDYLTDNRLTAFNKSKD
ncbi:DUF1559 domain-containing protein [Opitutaceae bacterium TAV4]|nr:DUF1559 domain-containing protein [Opitutaceae bacterium TAV4]RRJ98597.1 DUF1559 domain-containing protein [Opitutaceae bacterium TAV3]